VISSNWASRLVAALVSELAVASVESHSLPSEFQAHSIRATSPEVVELIFSYSPGGELRGMQIGLDSVRAAPWRIRVSSIDEVAWDLVHLWICEPRVMDGFLPPDENGVRWFPVTKWFDEVS